MVKVNQINNPLYAKQEKRGPRFSSQILQLEWFSFPEIKTNIFLLLSKRKLKIGDFDNISTMTPMLMFT